MSAVNYLHSSVEKHVEGDKRETHEEFIIHGSKGFTAKYYHKDNKQEVRVVVTKKDACKFQTDFDMVGTFLQYFSHGISFDFSVDTLTDTVIEFHG